MALSSISKRVPRLAGLSWDDCRLLVESVADYAIFMLDVDGFVATWNLGAEKIKGYRAEEIVGKHFSTFYPPEDLATDKPGRELAQATELGRIEDEGWRLRKDGSRFWANVIITALRDERGQLRGFAKVTRDVSERRRAEEELRHSEERFRALVDSVTDYAIAMLDPQGIVSMWNRGAERMKGYSAAEIIGQHFSRFFPEEDRRSGKPERELAVARAEGRFEEESWRIRKDGSRFWANVVVTPLLDPGGELVGFAKVTRDLTTRRAAEETERRLIGERAAREAAEEANRVKDEFLATVSHELRTPLNAVLGWATMLLPQRDQSPTLAKGLDAIHRNAQAQARIIDDLLDVSRIISGKLRLDFQPVNLVTIVHEAIDVVRPSAQAKGIALGFHPEDDVVFVAGDPERLRQVAWNLLSNAVKFTDGGGRVAVSVEQTGTAVVFQVRDTGRGIDLAFLPHVFQRFRQADPSTTRRVGGLGLGLAIVRHIVELHGGQVSAESGGRGQGATFRVTLPVRAVLPEPTTDDTANASRGRPRRPHEGELFGVRVLVVDDDDDARELVQLVLAGAGAAVTTASSAEEGITALRREKPHVLISDIGMPDEDGYSFIRRARELAAGSRDAIPSIALTAYTRTQDRTRALAAGFTTHIGKPVNPDDLVAAVANLAALMR